MLGDSGRLADGACGKTARVAGRARASEQPRALRGVSHSGVRALVVHGGRARAFGSFPCPCSCRAGLVRGRPAAAVRPVVVGGLHGADGRLWLGHAVAMSCSA
jgi:hypothetical protein